MSVPGAGGHSFDVFLDNKETKEIIEKTLGFMEWLDKFRSR